MKILFLTRRFYPEIGGVEKHILEISKNLIALDHEISVVSESYHSIGQSDTQGIKSNQPVKSIQSDIFEFRKIKVHSFNFGPDNFFKKFKIWAKLIKHISLIRDADVIHCHDVFYWYLPFRFFFPRKRIFTTFHGYEGYPVKKKALIIRKISEILSNGSICVGSFMKKWYNARPDYVIYGGVGKKVKFHAINDENSRTALFVGRLDEQTNILEYCRAAQKIRIAIPGFRMDIAGDGKYRDLAKKYAKVLGFIQNPEKLLLEYQIAFASRYLSIIEALAAKKPVFAYFDNPLKEDYLKMTPFSKFIYIAGSERELASQVQFYYSNKKSEQIRVKNGYDWVQAQSWDKVTNIYLELWSKYSRKT